MSQTPIAPVVKMTPAAFSSADALPPAPFDEGEAVRMRRALQKMELLRKEAEDRGREVTVKWFREWFEATNTVEASVGNFCIFADMLTIAGPDVG